PLVLGGARVTALTHLPAGRVLTPARPRRRRQAAHRRLGPLQPPLQGGRLALRRRLRADDRHPLGPGALPPRHYGTLRPLELIPLGDELLLAADLDDLRHRLAGQR